MSKLIQEPKQDYRDYFLSVILRKELDMIRPYIKMLPPAQLDLFNRMYPNLGRLNVEEMAHAYYQVRTAVDTNAGKKLKEVE